MISLEVKNTNYINLILFLIFFAAVFLTYVQKLEGSQELVGTVVGVEKYYKYKTNYINVNFKDNEPIVVAYQSSFFKVEDFLLIKIGDSLKYSLSDNAVVSISNVKNGNEIGELYFSIQESRGYQILIILFLLIFNTIQMEKLKNIIKITERNETNSKKTTLAQKMNDFTKKHFVITLSIIGLIIFFLYSLLNLIKQNQVSFESIYFYKYLILLSDFLIPIPFVIVNYKLLKKLNCMTNNL